MEIVEKQRRNGLVSGFSSPYLYRIEDLRIQAEENDCGLNLDSVLDFWYFISMFNNDRSFSVSLVDYKDIQIARFDEEVFLNIIFLGERMVYFVYTEGEQNMYGKISVDSVQKITKEKMSFLC